MYYALLLYPQLDTELAAAIDGLRRQHDPTVRCVKAHITVVFPIPDRVGEAALVRHFESVLTGWSSFDIRLGGFYESPDHWLLLNLTDGEAEVKQLYRSLYTGILSEFRRDDIEFTPHLGLGLFLKEGARYDWDNPQDAEFDRARYEEALQQSKTLPLGPSWAADRLHFVTIPDEIIDWAAGNRSSIPEEARIVDRCEFRLG